VEVSPRFLLQHQCIAKVFRVSRAGLNELTHAELRKHLHRQIASGISETTTIPTVLDSLEMVELTMQIEQPGMAPFVPVETVRDLLWLINAIEFVFKEKRGRLQAGYTCHLRPALRPNTYHPTPAFQVHPSQPFPPS